MPPSGGWPCAFSGDAESLSKRGKPGPLTWVAPALFQYHFALPPGCGEMGHPSLSFIPA